MYVCLYSPEAFSSLRIEGYKNIVRFHINRSGDLEVYTLGVDRVPKSWMKDPMWSGHTVPGTIPSHEWEHPSILKPVKGQPDRTKLIDYLVINKNPRSKERFIEKVDTPPPATSTRSATISQLVAPSSPILPTRALHSHTHSPHPHPHSRQRSQSTTNLQPPTTILGTTEHQPN